MSYYSTYRWCAVPDCKNTSVKTPHKLWIRVPTDLNIKKTWFMLARRNLKLLNTKTRLYFCEDHFNLEHDMENYVQYKIMGSVQWVRLNPNCVPSRFSWNTHHNAVSNEYNLPEVKKRRISLAEYSPQDIVEVNVKPSLPCIEGELNSNNPNVDHPYEKITTMSSNACASSAENTESLEEKPLMMLFQRLIGNSKKQNTILTNFQINEILQKEFNIDVHELHELEVEIYLCVMKKFLKDWPQWDEFDGLINSLKQKGSNVAIQNVLQEKYREIKAYLADMLITAKEQGRNTLKKLQPVLEKINENDDSSMDAVLEVFCSRTHLNRLIFRQPRQDLNNTIFNITLQEPSKISLAVPTLESLLNWWNIKIHVTFSDLYLTRETLHEFEHTLINTKLTQNKTPTRLNTGLQEKIGHSNKPVSTEAILTILDREFNQVIMNENAVILKNILLLLKQDFEETPKTLKTQSSYRRYMNKYKYVRYLSTEVEGKVKHKYDLYLKEIVSPMFGINIGRVDLCGVQDNFIAIECKSCETTFSGSHKPNDLLQHLWHCHMDEPDFLCTNCGKSFTMIFLANNRWWHSC